MNTRCYMVIIKGEIKTSEIMSCGYNRNTQKWDVKFNNGKTYSYAYLNVEKLTDPEVLKEDTVQASRDLLKNHIMELYEIPLLRFMTNGSGEKEKIIEMLDKLVG